MHQSHCQGHHFFLVAPCSSFLFDSALPSTHFNYFILQCPALFPLHFPVPRPCLSHFFPPLIPGLPWREWDHNNLTGELYLGGLLGGLIFWGGLYPEGNLC